MKWEYPRLRKLKLSDEVESADQLPVHVILGEADYQRIRSTETPILGNNPDLPWSGIHYAGMDLIWEAYFRRRWCGEGIPLTLSRSEFKRLCSMDVLGLDDTNTLNPSFHQNFKEQIEFKSEGVYETRLPCKLPHGPLPTNRGASNGTTLENNKALGET